MNQTEYLQRLQLLAENKLDFDQLALELFAFQSVENQVFAEYLERIGKTGFEPASVEEIPFLPISLFKSREVFCRNFEAAHCFRSSGTGGERSRHFISDPHFCAAHSRALFRAALGNIQQYEIIALLPGYEENPDSSLIFMVKALEQESTGHLSFCGMNFPALQQALSECRKRNHRPLVFGVSHALLSLLESGLQVDFSDVLLIETGGMKGLRRELSKAELLNTLQEGFRPEKLVSEFGMCELSSQAYGFPELYQPGFSLNALVRNAEDPLGPAKTTGRGVLNFIDLANFSSCAFIAGEDLGEVYSDGSFSVAGRLDQAEIRGCNLLFAPDSIS